MKTHHHSFNFYLIKPLRWPRILQVAIIFAANILLFSVGHGQASQPIAASAPLLPADQSSTAAITFSDGSSLKVESASTRFPLVAAAAGQTLNIQLRFPSSLGRAAIIPQALDGGNVSADSATAADGTASIQFQPASQPGLYRVLLKAGNLTTMLQFWVADPQNSSLNPPALKP